MGRRLGERYEVGAAIGVGGTATVHVGRLHGSEGFSKTVAIKRLHTHLATDDELRTILVDEARIVSRISHPNVVAVLDIAEEGGEVFLVLEYARGATLADLAKDGPVPPAIAVAILRDALAGLHAAHHARDTSGALLELVHRDVTPRNVIVTSDGVAKVLDFGIARARARSRTTRDGHIRGSLPYMSPEQVRDEALSARTDVYGAAIVLWEALTGERLFAADSDAAVIQKVLDHDVPAPSTRAAAPPASLDSEILRACASDPNERYASALEMATALESALAPASAGEVAAWLRGLREADLAARDVWKDAEAAVDVAEEASHPRPIRAKEPPVERSSPVRLAALGVVGAAATALFFLSMRSAPATATATATAATATAAATASASASANAFAPATATAPAVATATATATASDPASPEPTQNDRGRPRVEWSVRARKGATAAGSASGRGAGHCEPFYIDDAGVRRFNRECL